MHLPSQKLIQFRVEVVVSSTSGHLRVLDYLLQCFTAEIVKGEVLIVWKTQ